MDKEKYFEISKKLKISLRCPVLAFCERRFATLLYFEKVLRFEKTINTIGLIDGITAGEGYFENFCPEVHLFPSGTILLLSEACDLAVKSCWYNWKESKEFVSIEYSHYSECPEYANYKFQIDNKQLDLKKQLLNNIAVKLIPEMFDKNNEISDDEIVDRIINISLKIFHGLENNSINTEID